MTEEKPKQDQAGEKKKIKLSEPAQKFFNENPELMASVENTISGQSQRLAQLKERADFLKTQMSVIDQQLKAYSSAALPVPAELQQAFQLIASQQLRISAEYVDEFNNAKPISPVADQGDTIVEVDGKQVPVNRSLLEGVKRGDSKAYAKINELIGSEDPNVQEEARAIARSVGEDILGEQQTRFKDNGEVDIQRTTTPPAEPVNLPPSQPIQQKNTASVNSSIIQHITDALKFAGPGGASSAVGEAGAKLGAQAAKVKGSK